MAAGSLSDKLKFAYARVYLPDGYDPVLGQLDKNAIDDSNIDDANKFMLHPITMLTSFLSMSNRLVDGSGEQSWSNIGYNFIGWRPVNEVNNVSTGEQLFRALVVAPVITPYHVLKMILKIPVNIIALVTELLPEIGQVLFNEMAEWAKQKAIQAEQSDDYVVAPLAWLLYAAANSGYYATKAFSFVGRATTSPFNAIRASFYEGRALANLLVGENNDSYTATGLRWTLGIGLATLSAFTTGAVYVFAFPAAMHLVTATIAPWVVSHLPSAVNTALAPAAAKISQGLSWIDANIVKNIGMGIEDVVRNIGIGLSPAGAMLGGKVIFRVVSMATQNLIHYCFDEAKRVSNSVNAKGSAKVAPLRAPLKLGLFGNKSLDSDRPQMDRQVKIRLYSSM